MNNPGSERGGARKSASTLSARRRRREISRAMFMTIIANVFRFVRRSDWRSLQLKLSVVVSSMARTVAERGAISMSDISPKQSPWCSVATCSLKLPSSEMRTSASPRVIR